MNSLSTFLLLKTEEKQLNEKIAELNAQLLQKQEQLAKVKTNGKLFDLDNSEDLEKVCYFLNDPMLRKDFLKSINIHNLSLVEQNEGKTFLSLDMAKRLKKSTIRVLISLVNAGMIIQLKNYKENSEILKTESNKVGLFENGNLLVEHFSVKRIFEQLSY